VALTVQILLSVDMAWHSIARFLRLNDHQDGSKRSRETDKWNMEPSHSVRHNRAGRVYFMRVETLRMESLKGCGEGVDVCLFRYHLVGSCW
jgi:hypothetical protein